MIANNIRSSTLGAMILAALLLWPAMALADLPGETCGNAIDLVGPLPISVAGSTIGYTDDYDEVCPFAGSLAPDVVYAYTPAADERVDISLCLGATDFDTKLYVYEDVCPDTGRPIACNDDGCISAAGVALTSMLHEVALLAGHTYYIVVDGYGMSAGDYQLDIYESPILTCPDDQFVLFSRPPALQARGQELSGAYHDFKGASEFHDLAGVITGLRVWGLKLKFNTLAQHWDPCGDDTLPLIVKFTDGVTLPYNVVATYTINAVGTPIASAEYDLFDVYEFTLQLPTPLLLRDGWVWIGSPTPPPYACQIMSLAVANDDYRTGPAFCLLNDGTTVFGACCDEATGVCQEGVSFGDCRGRFIEGGTCADFDPPCTVVTGACCQGNGACSLTTLADCPSAGTCRGDLNCDGEIGMADINPFVLALIDPTEYAAEYPACDRANADCDQNGLINFGDVNAFIARMGARCGRWLGPDTVCDACDPGPIALPRDLPFVDTDTTCGRGNTAVGPCPASQLWGQDTSYEMVVTEAPVDVTITVTGSGASQYAASLAYVGPGESRCVAQGEKPYIGPIELGCLTLVPGTYQLTVDLSGGGGDPNCLPQYTITIAECDALLGRCCFGQPPECADLTEFDCQEAGGTWNPDVDCTTPCDANAGDACSDARLIASLPFSATFDSTTLIAAGPAAPCDKYGAPGNMQNDAWFVWTAPADGLATATTLGDPNHPDVTLVVRDRCWPSTVLYCTDDVGADPNRAETLTFAATAGQRYLFQVGDVGNHPAGGMTTFTLTCATASGACCLPDGSCQTLPALTCFAQHGTYAGDATDCAGVTCPAPTPGNTCSDPILVPLNAGSLPFVDINTTRGRGDDYHLTCLGSYDDGEDIVYKLTVANTTPLRITLDPQGTRYTGLLLSETCPGGECVAMAHNAGADPYDLGCLVLPPGDYFIMVDKWLRPAFIEQFTLTVEACDAPTGACCVDGTCIAMRWETDCLGMGGLWYAGQTCSAAPCATPLGGENCGNPIVINIPADLSYNHTWTTCGRLNDYQGTGLAPYDTGEDMLFKLVVTGGAQTIAITSTPSGDAGPWMRWALSTTCPPTGDCTIGDRRQVKTTLAPGEYYLMVDTWDPPACGGFTLQIQAATPGSAPDVDPAE